MVGLLILPAAKAGRERRRETGLEGAKEKGKDEHEHDNHGDNGEDDPRDEEDQEGPAEGDLMEAGDAFKDEDDAPDHDEDGDDNKGDKVGVTNPHEQAGRNRGIGKGVERSIEAFFSSEDGGKEVGEAGHNEEEENRDNVHQNGVQKDHSWGILERQGSEEGERRLDEELDYRSEDGADGEGNGIGFERGGNGFLFPDFVKKPSRLEKNHPDFLRKTESHLLY